MLPLLRRSYYGGPTSAETTEVRPPQKCQVTPVMGTVIVSRVTLDTRVL